jgi:lipase
MAPVDGFVDAGDVRLHYVDWGGEGVPLVLVHATGFHARLWDPYAERLHERFRVIALDQRGHGDSGLPPGGTAGDALAWTHLPDDAHALIRALGIAGCSAAGHSSGGTAVAVCAARYPGSIGRLLLIDPVLSGGTGAGTAERRAGNPMAERTRRRRAVWESPAQFAAAMRGRDIFARWRPEFLRLYAEHGLRRREDGAYELKCLPEVEAAMYDAAPRFNPWPELGRLAVPALLLRATLARDGGSPTPPDAASRIPGCREVPVAATHFIPMEAPEAVLEALEALHGDGRAHRSEA